MKKIDLQALKGKHRLEAVMQELGEAFDAHEGQWSSKTTPGLHVDIQQQTYVYQRPGLDPESGDLVDWLKWRFHWTFKMTVAYLQKRDPDPQQELRPAVVLEREDAPVAAYPRRSSESEHRDRDKEDSGLYEYGVGHRYGKTYHVYLLKPLDAWQEKALEIGGERMREYFTWKAYELLMERDLQPVRFVAVQDVEIARCDQCEEFFEWWKDIYAFEYELWGETFCICEECKRKKITYRKALDLLYRSARAREEIPTP